MESSLSRDQACAPALQAGFLATEPLVKPFTLGVEEASYDLLAKSDPLSLPASWAWFLQFLMVGKIKIIMFNDMKIT